MKGYDRGSSLFWLLLSTYVCIASLRMGIGTLRNPGMGFMTFGAAGILGILSLILFTGSFFKGARDELASSFSGILWKRILFVIIVIIGYAKFMPDLGYPISTFLLMSSLFLILKRTRWWWALGLSLVTTLLTYYIFSECLNCQFPRGPFGL
jgi:tripartite tricarboxylate transporter TctB family protein